jgi:hypothetical protein
MFFHNDLIFSCSMYREELVKEGAHDVDKRLEQGF